MLRNAEGRPEEALALARQALEITPAHDDYVRCQIQFEIAGAHRQMRNDEAARDAYAQVIRQGQTSG